ncbi:unnamed protein product, partial [Mesorhabditis belari]|uniref:26S proteasome non-ATPase regulatory subunit 4 n=1 Tax=Mesorhabditis belari TaxID=2138241 RepID=A0AAF3F534_9BILA
MVQESTMICVDNSEFMRNGDFAPTRLQCQQDAANLVVQCKLRANPENAVGVLSMAGEVTVLSTMTQESSRLFMKLHQLEPKGECKVISAIKIAHLALKHRQNRNHKMRIVLFCGSPVEDVDVAELTKVAKKLKKEKVQADIVCFGEVDAENAKVFEQFIDTLNGKEGTNSHLVIVSSGSTLTEAIANSAVCRGEDGTAAPINIHGGGFEFGVDPDEDPDLALALRVSLEEQRARQAAEAAAAGGGGGGAANEPASQEVPSGMPDVMDMDVGAMDEDQQLEWALRMSMQQDPNAQPSTNTEGSGNTGQQSMDTQPAEGSGSQDDLLNNPELLQQMVNNLPGSTNEQPKDDKDKDSEHKAN